MITAIIISLRLLKSQAKIFPENQPPTAPAMLKIGRYMAITSPPIMPPRKHIINGSIAAVRFSTAWSTSSS